MFHWFDADEECSDEVSLQDKYVEPSSKTRTSIKPSPSPTLATSRSSPKRLSFPKSPSAPDRVMVPHKGRSWETLWHREYVEDHELFTGAASGTSGGF
jgi:hypothetical protein